MDSIEAARLPPGNDAAAGEPAFPSQSAQAGQTLGLSVILMAATLLAFALGAAIRRHIHAAIYPTAVAAAIAAGCALLLLIAAELRRRRRGRTRLMLGVSAQTWTFAGILLLFLEFYTMTLGGATPFYEPAAQAAAFLHGHSWVDVPGYMEQVGPICNVNLPIARRLPECSFTRYGNHTFLVHPPLAAIVMMPVVALHGGVVDGADRYQPEVCAVLGAIAVALAWRLLVIMGMSASACLWLTAFFGVGTTIWYEATLGSSWDFVLVVSLIPTLLALAELFGKARPWLVAVFAGLAALGRNDLVLAWPAYALLLMVRGRRMRDLFAMLPGFAMAGAVYGIFNYTRYGTFFDQSLWLWYRCCDGGGFRSNPAIPGPFSPHFLPTNLYTVLFLGWGFNATAFPWIRPQGAGQALVLTSPAFILALRPSLKRAAPVLIWLAAILTMGASLTVYASGFVQFGPRYYVQIFPFLLVLVALGVGAGKRVDQLTKILILASMFIVVFGVWQIRTIGFG